MLLSEPKLTIFSSRIYPEGTLWTSESPSCRSSRQSLGQTHTATSFSPPEHTHIILQGGTLKPCSSAPIHRKTKQNKQKKEISGCLIPGVENESTIPVFCLAFNLRESLTNTHRFSHQWLISGARVQQILLPVNHDWPDHSSEDDEKGKAGWCTPLPLCTLYLTHRPRPATS